MNWSGNFSQDLTCEIRENIATYTVIVFGHVWLYLYIGLPFTIYQFLNFGQLLYKYAFLVNLLIAYKHILTKELNLLFSVDKT